MIAHPRPQGLTALSLALAMGSLLSAQAPSQAPDREAYHGPQSVNYKRFTRGEDLKIQDEAERRLEWWRLRLGGDLSPEFMAHIAKEAEGERRRFPTLFPRPGQELPAALNGTTWVSLGPTTSAFTQNGITLNKVDSGRLRTILADPADGNTVYALSAGGGLWKTTNFLNATPTWTPKTDALGSTAGGAVAFGRTTSVLYVGTGDPFDGGVGGFLSKSTDGGDTWGSNVTLTGASVVYDIKVDTSVGGTTATDIVLAGTNAGLLRSSDGGATFSAATGLSTSLRVWSIVKTSAGWLCSAYNPTGSAVNGVSGSQSGLFVSTDQGASWSPITNTGGVYAGAGRSTLAVGLPGDAVVYCYAANTGSASQLDLFRSADGGQTWTALGIGAKTPSNALGDVTTMNIMGGQAWYNQMVLVDPSDAARNTVYLGGQLGSVRTTDGGGTWRVLSDWLAQGGLPYIHADFHCAAAVTIGPTTRLFFGTDGGLFTSTDSGITWDDSKNVGLATHLIYALAANPATTGSAWVGLQDNGTRMRVGTTSTFNQLRGGDGFGVGWSQANQASVLASYVYNSIRRSTTNPPTDQGNFASFVTGLGSTGNSDNGASYYFVTPINFPTAAADPTGNVFFTYSNSGTGTNSKKIFKSSGSGWTAIGTAGAGGISAGRFVRALSHGISVHPTDLNRIAAAGNGGVLLVTTNGGTAWTEYAIASLGVATWPGFNANAAWASNDKLYLCTENTATGAPRVVKTTNLTSGSPTFTNVSTGLPDVPVSKVVVDPGDATGDTVYAATWLGVYRTTNGGTSWSRFGAGLPQGRVTDLYIAPDSSFLRVSTWGRGVWELPTAPAGPTVSVSPTTATVVTGGTVAITPTVTNTTTSNNVNWTVTSGSVSPTTTATGVATTFTAPGTAGNVTVTATTVEAPAGTATSTVTVVDPTAVTVTMSPTPTTSAVTSGTVNFTGSVAGITNTGLNWTTSGGSFNLTTGGAVTWTAPASAGAYTVTATAAGAPTRSATTTVTVIDPAAITISVNPTTKTLRAGGSQAFTATVSSGSVTWTLSPASGAGTITPSGLTCTYNAPATVTTNTPVTLTATATLNNTKTAVAAITLKTLDLNGDGSIDVLDILELTKRTGSVVAGDLAKADLDGNGAIDDSDLAILLAGI